MFHGGGATSGLLELFIVDGAAFADAFWWTMAWPYGIIGGRHLRCQREFLAWLEINMKPFASKIRLQS